jgi:high frequency lysogenization protein
MSIENSTLALAGMYQSASLVRDIARQGLIDQEPFEASLNSILKIDAASIEDVYGGLVGLKVGLQTLCQQLGGGSKRTLEITHYVLGMMILERKLIKNNEMLEQIQTGIEATKIKVEAYAVADPEIINDLATLYHDTLSQFNFRIKVNGERRFLENPNNADKIRALLLAGIRSGVLWRQKGGNRLHLIFSRKKMVNIAQAYLKQINQSLE